MTRSRAAVVALLGAALLAVHGVSSAGGVSGAVVVGAHTTPASATALGWLQHTDRATGFVIAYPDSWNVYQSKDAAVQFLAGPDESDFVEVRVISNLPADFPSTNSQVTRRLVDGLLANPAITIVSTTEVRYSGLPGWQYAYKFTDARLGVGVHIHVFLFQGNRLHTLVFQALPQTNLKALAPTFDAILGRYRALPLPSGTTPRASPAGTPPPAPTATP